MARLVLIIAKSGTGKSSSMRNLTKAEANVISCSGKELPFRSELTSFQAKSYTDVVGAIQAAKAPIVVVDDANYLMSFEEMSRINEVGYQKFGQMAANMFGIFKAISDKQSDQTFYIMAHANEEAEQLRFKTTGKMLDEKIVLEGLTNILITCEFEDGEFVFKMKTDGTGVKSPIGMFKSDTMPNDLKLLDKQITEYYKPAPAPKKESKK